MKTHESGAILRAGGVAVIWLAALAVALLIIAMRPSQPFGWLALGAAGCVVATLALQLGSRHTPGAVMRMVTSLGGAVIVFAAVSALVPFLA